MLKQIFVIRCDCCGAEAEANGNDVAYASPTGVRVHFAQTAATSSYRRKAKAPVVWFDRCHNCARLKCTPSGPRCDRGSH